LEDKLHKLLKGEIIHMKVHSALVTGFMLALCVMFLAGCQKSGVEAGNVSPSGPTAATSSVPGSEEELLGQRSFVTDAAKSLTRMQSLSGVALKRATKLNVREYAQRTLDNYTGALQQLSDLMKKKGMSQPVSLPELKIEAANRLQYIPAGAVDAEFISLMTAEQQQVIASFQRASEAAGDPDVRAYAKGVLPVLQKDYTDASGIENSLAAKEGHER
jgi:predicted outer membrane protein